MRLFIRLCGWVTGFLLGCSAPADPLPKDAGKDVVVVAEAGHDAMADMPPCLLPKPPDWCDNFDYWDAGFP